MVARSHGYVIVNRTLGLDLFLVRMDLWGERPVPSLAELQLGKCMNMHMTREMAHNLLDYEVLTRASDAAAGVPDSATAAPAPSAVCAARAAAAATISAAARGGRCRRSCFLHVRGLEPAERTCGQDD